MATVSIAPPPPPPPPQAPPGGEMSNGDGTVLQVTYRFERGTSKNGVSANAVGNALEFLRRRDGLASARAFVDYSRPPTAETHPIFEWDDAVAAEQFRVIQARETIRELRVLPADPNVPVPKGPVYVHVTQAQTPINGYAPAWVVVSRTDWTAQAQRECLAQLLGLQRRYQFLQDLASVWDAILAAARGHDDPGTGLDIEEPGVLPPEDNGG